MTLKPKKWLKAESWQPRKSVTFTPVNLRLLEPHKKFNSKCIFKDGDFHMAPGFMLEDLEEIFQYKVLKMLKKEGKITDVILKNMLSWRHSGFHVYIGDKIFSNGQSGLGNLAQYISLRLFRFPNPGKRLTLNFSFWGISGEVCPRST